MHKLNQSKLIWMMIVIFISPSLLSAQSNGDKYSDLITFTGVDALKKVLREDSYFEDYAPIADVAKGEHASFQFVIRSAKPIKQLKASVESPKFENNVLKDVKSAFLGYVKVSRFTPKESVDCIHSPSGYFPDPILEDSSLDVQRDATQPVWITINIPKNAATGLYIGKITITGMIDQQPFRLTKTFSVNVYPVVMNTPRLWVANWYWTDADNLAYLNDGKPVKIFTDKYWELVGVFAKQMKEYYQNVIWISPLALTKYTLEKGKYRFDFAGFDRFAKIFMDAGITGRLEGAHLGGRAGDWLEGYQLYVPSLQGDSIVLKFHPMSDSVTTNFYNQFLPALMTHLKEKKWDKVYLQNIGDEPVNENASSYMELASFIKKIVPEIQLTDAIHTTKLDSTLKVWVPMINYANTDHAFFDERMKAGDEVWIYTCCVPKEEYPNRFVEMPLLKTRLLHWVNFKYGYTGYLHWGYNYWIASNGENVFDEASGILGGGVLPGGDSWIVYPYKGHLLSSIRLEAMRDGIADYELLKMLETKNPDKAKELCAETVQDFTHLDISTSNFRKVRKEILNLLSK